MILNNSLNKDGPICNNNKRNNNDGNIINSNICESSIGNVSESSIDLPNKFVKDKKSTSIKSNINLPLPKLDTKECIKKNDHAFNNNERNNKDEKIINSNVCESSIDNSTNMDLPINKSLEN